MSYGVMLRVWGSHACFTRPEMKVERLSYEVMTPSAARGLLEAIHWQPAIRWVVDAIHVLRPIRFESLRRNEVGNKVWVGTAKEAMKRRSTVGLRCLVEAERQPRAATILRDVEYLVAAHCDMTPAAGPHDTPGKHRQIFMRRAGRGQCFHRPYLGCREFPADFALVEREMPATRVPLDQRPRDLGWMLHDIDFAAGMKARFFHARLDADAVVAVPAFDAARPQQ